MTANTKCKCGHKKKEHGMIGISPCYVYVINGKKTYRCICEKFEEDKK